uniref:Uncharacterized protein n=1 Tax=Rhizophora mucronata TaxID=61149 RepID=A0A2P2P225_RHIMU
MLQRLATMKELVVLVYAEEEEKPRF